MRVKSFSKMLPHPVERNLIDEAVVGDKADDPVSARRVDRCPAEELDIRIVKRCCSVSPSSPSHRSP